MSEKEHAPSLTLEGLERLAELEEKATPGPWENAHDTIYVSKDCKDARGPVVAFNGCDKCCEIVIRYDDRDFISLLRNNAKELLRLAEIGLRHEAKDVELREGPSECELQIMWQIGCGVSSMHELRRDTLIKAVQAFDKARGNDNRLPRLEALRKALEGMEVE